MEAEEDFVLQREFRIDFVFRKVEPKLPLGGIFSYFRAHNLFEFKSVNDAFDLVQLRKYLGELFWWLYIKDEGQLEGREVTLTIMIVRRPSNVLKYLQQLHSQIGLRNESPGHYQWSVMEIEVHLLVINELDVLRKHYAWLLFAEGRKFEAYREQLSQDISGDETYQTYLDMMSELEQEGKARMADEILQRVISRMPPERLEKIFLSLPGQLEQEGKGRMADEILQRVISRMSPERAEKLILGLPAAVTQQLQVNAMKKMLSQLLQAKFGALPEEAIVRIQNAESEEELSNLAKKLITASSLAELGLS